MSTSESVLAVSVPQAMKVDSGEATTSASVVLMGSNALSREQRSRLTARGSVKEKLFAAIDVVAVTIVFAVVRGFGQWYAGLLGLLTLVAATLNLKGNPPVELPGFGWGYVADGATLVMIALLSWRVSVPLEAFLKKRGDYLSGQVLLELEAERQSISFLKRQFSDFKRRLFAGIDVTVLAGTLLVLLAGMGLSLWSALAFLPLVGDDMGEWMSGESVGYAVGPSLIFLSLWRLSVPTRAILTRRWNSLLNPRSERC